MKKYLKTVQLDRLQEVVDKVFQMGDDCLIWTFVGDLGAGKTTLIRALAQQLGIEDPVSSPTFNYVNDYDGKVYHFDCYRLKNVEEALGFGLEEYLDSGKRCWIEWPEVVKPLLNESYLEIEISHNSDETRTYTISRI